MTRRDILLLPAIAYRAPAQQAALRQRVIAVLRKHCDQILTPEGNVPRLKGKDSAALMAMTFEVMHGITHEVRYRSAAIQLADRILEEMKATPLGVLPIKEKGPESVLGGGPPALGWYTASLAFVCHRAGGREADIRYLAGVVDRYPWNPEGWWANTVDVATGKPLVIEKQTQVNKNIAMAMAGAVLSEYVQPTDAGLSASLRAKTRKCLYGQIIPAQRSDGYWHYGLTGRDPNNKDVIGYFMLAATLLIRLRILAPSFRDEALAASIARAGEFAAREIAPITSPLSGKASHTLTPATPSHFDAKDEPKRGFDLGLLLTDCKTPNLATKFMSYALDCFPYGDRGQDGGRCANDCATMLLPSVG